MCLILQGLPHLNLFHVLLILLGWWLAWADGKEGWVPASFLSPSIKLEDADQIPSHWISTSDQVIGGLKYITMAAFSAQTEEDLTLSECAVVEVVGKSLTGWWKVRLASYNIIL